MNVKGLAIVLIVILKVVSVKCACDDYLSCLGTFFSEFFNQKDKSPSLDSVIARNSESRNVDLDTKELDQVLHDVSGFLQEELEVHPDMDLKSMLFRKIHNQTAIYVKTYDIDDDYQDSEKPEKEETYYNPDIQNIEKSITVNPDPTNLNITMDGNNNNITNEEVSSVAPLVTNSTGSGFTQSIFTTKSHKLNITKDERKNKINTKDDSDLYYDNEDNATDYPILDYIEFYKDTTNEYVNLEPTVEPNVSNNLNGDTNSPLPNKIINSTLETATKGYASNTVKEISASVFPWLAAIFIKNSTTDQFDYYCDGALLSHSAVITAASCVQKNNSTVKAEDLIVLFGKTSLKTVGDNETVARIKSIKVHEEFTVRDQGNDLAILITEKPVMFADGVQAATLSDDGEDQAATTGWATTGELTPILLEENEKIACGEETIPEDTFCAVYGNDITVCPSYGGLYVTKQAAWHLRGIRTGDPEHRGLCFNRNIAFTSLNSHLEWIKSHME